MKLSENVEFSILGVGAIIEREIDGKPHILIQNRVRLDDATQNNLIEVPCGKVRSQQSVFETLQYRVKEETGLIVTEIKGQGKIYKNHPSYTIQSGTPFCVCQNIDYAFPICILFFVCTANEGTQLLNSEAATDIRWISLDDLKQKLDTAESLFFPFVLEALKKYIILKMSSGGNTMNVSELSFMNKFDPAKNTVKEFDHWIVTIREKQVTLGACIITLKRNTTSMSDVNEVEAAELTRVFSWYEAKMKVLFGAEKFNYVVAMMKDNFVHYHAFPRYSAPVDKFGISWSDYDWPKVVNFRNVTVDRNILDSIISEINK